MLFGKESKEESQLGIFDRVIRYLSWEMLKVKQQREHWESASLLERSYHRPLQQTLDVRFHRH